MTRRLFSPGALSHLEIGNGKTMMTANIWAACRILDIDVVTAIIKGQPKCLVDVPKEEILLTEPDRNL